MQYDSGKWKIRITMRIPPFETFPGVEQRAGWSKFLDVDASTLYRAEARGELTGTRTRTGRVLYTKEAILAWLNCEPLPASK